MNLTLHLAQSQPLLLPLLPEAPFPSDTNQQSGTCVGEEALCHALIERIAQTHPVVIAEPVSLHDLESRLEHAVRQDVTRILLLPWNLHGATAQIVPLAMNALHRTGAETVSATSLLLTHPRTVPDVSPAGSPGGSLPPCPRLDRCVEQWPGWQHKYTVVRSEQAAILIIHSSMSPSRQPGNQSWPDTLQRLVGTLCTTFCQEQNAPEPSRSDSRRRTDSVIYARYLSGMVAAALDALRSLPPVSPGLQE